jgi:hypothetical protein
MSTPTPKPVEKSVMKQLAQIARIIIQRLPLATTAIVLGSAITALTVACVSDARQEGRLQRIAFEQGRSICPGELPVVVDSNERTQAYVLCGGDTRRSHLVIVPRLPLFGS